MWRGKWDEDGKMRVLSEDEGERWTARSRKYIFIPSPHDVAVENCQTPSTWLDNVVKQQVERYVTKCDCYQISSL